MRRQARQSRREERRGGGGKNRYIMRQKLISIGDDFWIENGAGERVFKVDGKAVRVRDTLIIKDTKGNPVVKIQEKMLRIKDSMGVDDANGNQVAMVKKALISPLRDRYIVKIRDGADLNVKGNILNHEYTIGEGRNKVAQVSKKWFRIRDSYGVEVEAGQDDAIILAVAVCIDQMSHG